jgi:hypothetical protein
MRFLSVVLLASPLGFVNCALGQAVTSPVNSPAVLPALTSPSKPLWTELNGSQQQSLKPLAAAWASLTDTQKRKWIALAQNFQTMAGAEQAKFHERMTEWAALKPRERELARLNFAETKKVPNTNKAAQWEAYQALTPEERQKLAEKSTPKSLGAAIAVKPVEPNKLATVPVTRNTPEVTRAQEASKRPLDRNTLLPLAAKAPLPVTPTTAIAPAIAPVASEPASN